MFTLEQIESTAKDRAAEHAKQAFLISESELKETAETIYEEQAQSYIDLYNKYFEIEVNKITVLICEKAENHARNLTEKNLPLDVTALKGTLDNQYIAYLDLYIRQVEDNFEESKPKKQSQTSQSYTTVCSDDEPNDALEPSSEGDEFGVDLELEPSEDKSSSVSKKSHSDNEQKIRSKARHKAASNARIGIALNQEKLEKKAHEEYDDPKDADLYIKSYLEMYQDKQTSMSSDAKIRSTAQRRAKTNFGHGVLFNEEKLKKNAANEFSDPLEVKCYVEEYTKTYEKLSKGKSTEEQVKLRAISDAKQSMKNRTTKITIEQVRKRAARFGDQAKFYEETFLKTYEENKVSTTVALVVDDIPKAENFDVLNKAAYSRAASHALCVKPVDYDKFKQEIIKEYGKDAGEFLRLYQINKRKIASQQDEKSKVVSMAKRHGANAAFGGVPFDEQKLEKKAAAYGENYQVYFDEFKVAYDSSLKKHTAEYIQEIDDKSGKPLTEDQARIKHFAVARAKHNAQQGGKPKMSDLRDRAIAEFGEKHADFYVQVYKERHATYFKPKSDDKKVKHLAVSRAWELAQKGQMYDIEKVEQEAKEHGELAKLYKDTFISTHENKIDSLKRKGVNTTGTLDQESGTVVLDDTMVAHIAQSRAKRAAAQGSGLDRQELEKAALEYGDKATLYKDGFIKAYKENAVNGMNNVKKTAFNKGVESGKGREVYSEENVKKLAEKHPGLEEVFTKSFKEGFESTAAKEKVKEAKNAKLHEDTKLRSKDGASKRKEKELEKDKQKSKKPKSVSSQVPAAATRVSDVTQAPASPLLFRGPGSVPKPAPKPAAMPADSEKLKHPAYSITFRRK